MNADDDNDHEPETPASKTDAEKWAEMLPGLPPEDELREKLRRIKEDVEATFERMKREQNR